MNYIKYNKLLDKYLGALPNINLVRFFTPLNLREEKLKFFKNKFKTNPQFLYKEVDFDKPKFPVLESDELGILVNAKFKSIQKKVELIKSTNPDQFTQRSINLFGATNKDLVKQGFEIIKKNNSMEVDSEKVPFDVIKRTIQSVLYDLNLDIDIIVVDEPSFSNKISASKNSITISKQYIADQDEIVDLINHEIRTHIIRNKNGYKHPFKLFSYSSPGYLACEEGLATLMGHAFKKNKLMVHPALLYVAIDHSMNNDFISTFELLYSLCSDVDRAWTYALRSKRGISDTSEFGAYTKDAYLGYAFDTAEALMNDSRLLETAFDGKGKLEELNLYHGDFQPESFIDIEDIRVVYENNFVI